MNEAVASTNQILTKALIDSAIPFSFIEYWENRVPIISVIIPSFNRGHCLKICIESVLKQTFHDFEVIVVDDASTDDSLAHIKTLSDPRIRYLEHDTNRGGAAARNTGIEAAKGEFVAFLDSDDYWAPQKLEMQIKLLREKGEDYGFVYTWFVRNNPAGEELGRDSYSIDGPALDKLLVKNYIGTFSSVMVRKSALMAVDGLDVKMKSCQDWDLFIRLSRITRVCCVEDYLVHYLQNRNDRYRISSNPDSIIQGHKRLLEKISTDLAAMGIRKRVITLTGFMNTFILAGSMSDAVRIGVEILRLDLSFGSLNLFFRGILRVTKRKLTQNLGY